MNRRLFLSRLLYSASLSGLLPFANIVSSNAKSPGKVVIIGGGEVGFHVAKALSEEDYDITVVDIDPIKCRRASENLDVIVVEGNGASPNTLNEAKVGDADYVLCLT